MITYKPLSDEQLNTYSANLAVIEQCRRGNALIDSYLSLATSLKATGQQPSTFYEKKLAEAVKELVAIIRMKDLGIEDENASAPSRD